jgi:hypothetical protein
MPELPKVSQDFEANAGPYLAGIEAMLAANERLIASIEEIQEAIDSLHGRDIEFDLNADDVLEQVAEIKEYLDGIPDHKTVLITIGETGDTGDAANAVNDLTDALNRNAEAWSRVEDVGRDYSVMMGETIADATATSGALERVFSVSEGGVAEQLSVAEATKQVVDAMHEEAQATVDLHSGMAYTAADAALLGAALGSAVTDAAGATRAIAGVGAATADAGAIVASQGGAIAGFFSTWGTAIHWIVAGGSEILAVAIPATIALGAGALAAAEGAGWLADKMQGVFTATEATSSMLHQTTGSALGLKSSLQQAQTAADPGVYELLGAGLNIAKEAFGQFAQEGLDVVHVVDEFSAKMVLDLGPNGSVSGALDQLAGKGVSDLTQLGQVFGNLTHFITAMAAEMPGLAEVLLRLLDDFTGLLSVIASNGGGFITLAMGIEEAWRWGGLLSNVMGYWVSRLAVATQAFAGFLTKVQMGGQTVEEFNAAMTANMAEVDRAAGQYALYASGTEEAAAATAGLSEDQALLAASTRVSTEATLALAEAQRLAAASDAELAVSEDGLAAATDAAAVGMGTAAEFLLGPWGFAVAGAVAGAVILVKYLGSVKTTAEAMADSMETAINKANFSQGLSDIITDLPKLNDALNQSAKAAQGLSPALAQLPVRFSGISAAQSTAVAAAATYSSAIQRLTTQAGEILGANVKVGSSYATVSEAMALATAAGLNVGTAFQKDGQLTAVANQQIQDLIAGYKEMDQTGTTLANDINAVNEQALMQQTRVQALNQAWDGFISQMTGVSSSVASLYTDLTTIGNVTEVATSKIQAFSQGNTGLDLSVKQVAEALKTFGAGSAQVWTNFDSAVGQAEQALDGIRTAAAAGGITNEQYSESVKGIVAQLLPYAADSATATSELSALAQQAGGPATSNFATLSQWVGNTKNATQNLNQIVQQATQYMSNLGTVAANLASTMASAVDNAITAGSIDIKGITTATQGFETALHATGGEINSTMITALQGMITQLDDAHVPTQDQISILDQLARQAGLSSTAIQALNREIQSLQSKTVTVTVETQYITSGGGASAGINPSAGGAAPGHASGYLVPGFGGGDIHPALLEGGETVVPKELTPAIAPLMKAHGVPGFASGGLVGGSSLASLIALFESTGSFGPIGPIGPIGSGGGGGSAPVASPASSQFLGDWLPSSLMGAGASAAPSGGGTATLEVTQPIHIRVEMDGRTAWEGNQKETLRYNIRNNGVATGLQKPK